MATCHRQVLLFAMLVSHVVALSSRSYCAQCHEFQAAAASSGTKLGDAGGMSDFNAVKKGCCSGILEAAKKEDDCIVDISQQLIPLCLFPPDDLAMVNAALLAVLDKMDSEEAEPGVQNHGVAADSDPEVQVPEHESGKASSADLAEGARTGSEHETGKASSEDLAKGEPTVNEIEKARVKKDKDLAKKQAQEVQERLQRRQAKALLKHQGNNLQEQVHSQGTVYRFEVDNTNEAQKLLREADLIKANQANK